MRRAAGSVRRLVLGTVALAGAGAMAVSLGGVAVASQAAPAVPARSARAHPAAATAVIGVKAAWVPPSRVLWVGAHGTAVRRIQARLRALHYYPGKVDGQLGLDTMEAIWAFKAVQHLRTNAGNANEISRQTERAMVHPRPPQVLVRHGGSERIEVNLRTQVLVLYKHNRISLISHVSSGGGYYYPCPPPGSGTCGPAVTPDGNYRANWFASGWLKVPLGEMYNPVFFIGGAYAIHGDIPVPWYPASHGCVRIPMDIATWFYKTIRIGYTHGTRIYIRGTAHYYL
jgi:peptidoglycan hydrolase-like protein with peptidoglycan-binding domain